MGRLAIGTKSLLFGAHQFLLHPLYVTVAWRRLYGRWPRWWEAICILVHDWGYWGCPEMDGPQGEQHPKRGAEIAQRVVYFLGYDDERACEAYWLAAGHSRHYARLVRIGPSALMAADKLGAVLPPWWIYVPMARATGEIREYRDEAARYYLETGKGCPPDATDREWYRWLQGYMRSVAVKPHDEMGAVRAARRREESHAQ